MVGFYNKAAGDAPKIVQFADRMSTHRREILIGGGVTLALLVLLSFFQPTIGLILIAVLLLAAGGLLLANRARSGPHTHWDRHSHRR